MEVSTVFQPLLPVVYRSPIFAKIIHQALSMPQSSHITYPHNSSIPSIFQPSRNNLHKPIPSKRLAIKTPSQTQLISTNAIRTPIPLNHRQLIILLLPRRRPSPNKPLLSGPLHFPEPARIGGAVASPPRPPALVRNGVVGLRFILRTVHGQPRRRCGAGEVGLGRYVVLEGWVEGFFLRCGYGGGGVGVGGFGIDGAGAGEVFGGGRCCFWVCSGGRCPYCLALCRDGGLRFGVWLGVGAEGGQEGREEGPLGWHFGGLCRGWVG